MHPQPQASSAQNAGVAIDAANELEEIERPTRLALGAWLRGPGKGGNNAEYTNTKKGRGQAAVAALQASSTTAQRGSKKARHQLHTEMGAERGPIGYLAPAGTPRALPSGTP